MSLKSLLSEARRRKQLQPGSENASTYNFEDKFEEFNPSETSELADVFSYSESFFFPHWKAAFAKLGGAPFPVGDESRETLEAVLHALMEQQGNARETLAFAETVLRLLRGVGNEAIALNILFFLLVLFPEVVITYSFLLF